MMKLENFVGMMTGHFDNKDQFNKMQAEGKIYPYAEHVNTICNDKINNLPEDFKGKFVGELFPKFECHYRRELACAASFPDSVLFMIKCRSKFFRFF